MKEIWYEIQPGFAGNNWWVAPYPDKYENRTFALCADLCDDLLCDDVCYMVEPSPKDCDACFFGE